MPKDLLANESVDLLAGDNPAPQVAQKKSIFPDITTSMWEQHPILSAIAKTGQDVATLPANYLNQFLNNAPRGIFDRLNLQYPSETTNPVAQGTNKALGLLGAAESPLNKAIMASKLSSMGKGILAGVSYAPTQAKNILDDIKQRGQQAALTGLIGVASDATKPVMGAATRVLQNITKIKDPVAFAQAVRGSLFTNKQAAGQAFEQGIVDNMHQYPNNRVDLQDEFNAIKSAQDNQAENPGLAMQINGIIKKMTNPEDAKLMNSLIEDPSKAKNLTLQESQTIKTAINKAQPIAAKLQQGPFAQWSPAEMELLDLSHNVTAKQIEGYPQFKDTKAAYRDYIQNYNQVKNLFKPTQLLNRIRGGFGNEEIEQAVRKALGDQTYNNITGFRNAEKGVGYLKKGAGIAALGGAAKLGIDGFIPRH
jgi:hypothetical protein